MDNNLTISSEEYRGTDIHKGLYPESFEKSLEKGNNAKVEKVMGEFKDGDLKSSSGKTVTDKKQAIAIAMSEAGLSKSDEDDPRSKAIKEAMKMAGLEKGEESEFSDKPKKKEADDKDGEKPEPPSVEETHEAEMKAKALKQEESAKADKKCSYAKMSSTEKRALKVLLNIQGKSAKEKIEAVVEHFGVSKLGAMNILTDATKDMSEDDKKSKDTDVKKSEDNSLTSSSVSSGTVNKHGQTKQGDGSWKYIKKGERDMNEQSQFLMNNM